MRRCEINKEMMKQLRKLDESQKVMDKNVKFQKKRVQKFGTMIPMDQKYENNKMSMRRIYKDV